MRRMNNPTRSKLSAGVYWARTFEEVFANERNRQPRFLGQTCGMDELILRTNKSAGLLGNILQERESRIPKRPDQSAARRAPLDEPPYSFPGPVSRNRKRLAPASKRRCSVRYKFPTRCRVRDNVS